MRPAKILEPDARGAVVEDGQSVSQGKLDQLSRHGEREVGVFSWLAPGVFRRLAPTTKETVRQHSLQGVWAW